MHNDSLDYPVAIGPETWRCSICGYEIVAYSVLKVADGGKPMRPCFACILRKLRDLGVGEMEQAAPEGAES